MTNAAIVSGGKTTTTTATGTAKQAVGGHHNTTPNGLASAATKLTEDLSGSNATAGIGNKSVNGDQLETNSVSRLRSSESFRYVFRITNWPVIANQIVNHNCRWECPTGGGV